MMLWIIQILYCATESGCRSTHRIGELFYVCVHERMSAFQNVLNTAMDNELLWMVLTTAATAAAAAAPWPCRDG